MMHGHPTFGVVKGEAPQLVHRLSAVAGRAYCGKSVVILPRGTEVSRLHVCRRCAAIDESRREGLPSFEEATADQAP